MATIREWRLAIIAQAQTLLPPTQTFEGGVPAETQLPMDSNRMVLPYAVFWWGQRVPGGLGFAGIAGVRKDAHVVPFIVQSCAPTGSAAVDLADALSDVLWGFRPVDQGELREDGAGTIRQPLDMSGVNSRYQVPVSYVGTVDL
jgi:hypothetical protein